MPKEIGTPFNKEFLKDLNDNFKGQKTRVDNLITAEPAAGELEDLRVDNEGVIHPVARDRFNADAQKTTENFNAVNEQLAQKAQKYDVRHKDQKIYPEDLSESTLGLVTGESEINLLSIPQDRSVTMNKLSRDISGFNGYRVVPTYNGNGNLTKIEEKDGRVTKLLTIINYNSNGDVREIEEIFQEGGVKSNFNYTDEVLSSIQKSLWEYEVLNYDPLLWAFQQSHENVDILTQLLPSQARGGTTGVDHLARFYVDGVELFEVGADERYATSGVGGFYWSSGSMSLILEKGKYSSITQARQAHANLIIKCRMK